MGIQKRRYAQSFYRELIENESAPSQEYFNKIDFS